MRSFTREAVAPPGTGAQQALDQPFPSEERGKAGSSGEDFCGGDRQPCPPPPGWWRCGTASGSRTAAAAAARVPLRHAGAACPHEVLRGRRRQLFAPPPPHLRQAPAVRVPPSPEGAAVERARAVARGAAVGRGQPLRRAAVGGGGSRRGGARGAVRGRGGPAAAGGAPFPGRRGGPRRYAAGIMAGASAVSPLVCAFQRGARAWRMGHRPPLCRRHFNRPHLQYSTCCRQRGSPGAHTPPEGLGGEDGDGSVGFAAISRG